ncbi:hypothetical protein G6680_05025 [Polynucleobacter paneuropaeus]|nr:hypothetical protein [Polynucleobacter paneuropaeus]
MNGIAAALGQGAVPGRDLLFTYGPLASMATANDGKGFLFGLILRLLIAINLAVLLRLVVGPRFLIAAALIFFICPSNEALFYVWLTVIPLAIVVCQSPNHLEVGHDDRLTARYIAALIFAAILIPSLILAKLSFLPLSAVLIFLIVIFQLSCGNWLMVLALLLISAISLVILWIFSGQELLNLGPYLLNGEIIRGYTSAMEWDIGVTILGINLQFLETVLLYALSSLLITFLISQKYNNKERLFLLLSVSALLAVVIKVATVRHGGVHSIFPWIVLLVLTVSIQPSPNLHRAVRAVFIILLLAVMVLSPIYSGDGRGLSQIVMAARGYSEANGLDWQKQKHIPRFWITYIWRDSEVFASSLSIPLPGLLERWKNLSTVIKVINTNGESIQLSKAKAYQDIKASCGIDPVQGTADIYPTDINCLLAINQAWSPRPVLQSYSAYTPNLLFVNRNHLTGASAPDFLFFDIHPIDDRLPMLEEGNSWACISNQYRPVGAMQGRFLLLKRKAERGQKEDVCSGIFKVVETRNAMLDEPVRLSCDHPQIWGSFELQPTLVGRLASTFYKTKRLMIDITTCDGHSLSYRFIPSMANAPFLFSPVIDNTSEFKRVMFEDSKESAHRVSSFVIRSSSSESPVRGWEQNFTFQLLDLMQTTGRQAK